MFKLTKHTSKQEVFAVLEANLRLSNKEVLIFVDSLPPFMSTRIALSIFSYQINNYPKKLIWQTTDEGIYKLLSSVGFIVQNLVQTDNSNLSSKNVVGVDSQADSSSLKMGPRMEIKTNDLEDTTNQFNSNQTVGSPNNYRPVQKVTQTSVAVESSELDISKPSTKTNWGSLSSSNNQSTGPVKIVATGSNSSLVLVNSKARSLLEFKQKLQTSSNDAVSHANQTLGNSRPVGLETDINLKTVADSKLTVESTTEDDSSITYSKSQDPKKYVNDFNAWQSSLNNQKSTPKLNLDNLTKQTQYKSNKLLQENHFYSNHDQDLDQWLARIRHTKQAIDSTKLADSSNPKINAQIVSFQPKVRSTKIVKRLYLFTSAVLSMLLLMLLLITLPTNVYTIKIDNPLIESSTTISLPVSKFNKKIVSATVSSTIESTGTKEVETTNATGKVILVNASGNNISLTNGGFYLIKDGKKYKHEFDPNLPGIITIPARNDLNGPRIEVAVRAVNPGAGANLPENTRFSIVNLKEQTLGNALFAISVTPIQNKELSGDRVVTQSDLDLLASLNQGKLAQEVGKELAKLRSENLFTDPDWYTMQIANGQADAKVGQVQPKVTLTTEAVITLYYLPKDYLTQLIQSTNSEINQITDVVIKKYSGELSQLDNQISLDVFFNYTKKAQLDKNLIGQTLATEKDSTKAEELLKKQFPSIKKIEKREVGISIPIVSPKIQVEIVEHS